MKTFKELNELIINWAKERELDTKGTVQGQKMKTIEELAELLIGISKDNKEVIKDSVGDVAVTLIIGNMLDVGYNMEELYNDVASFNTTYCPTKFDKVCLVVTTMESAIGGYHHCYLRLALQRLIKLSKCYDLEFLDCLESAYNEIANRKGKMIDGTFVKEQDL